MSRIPKLYLIIAVVAILGIGISWAFIASIQPLPGIEALQEGREHVPPGSVVNYEFNPPTSGNHYGEPSKPGMYDIPPADGNLVHSLEHGYIIISYNCDKEVGFNLIPQALAHGTQEEHATESAESSASATLPESFNSDDCNNLKSQLRSIYDKKGPFKLIVTPRSGMDTRIALTSWGRYLNLSEFDQERIEKFIDKLRDHGPEKTME